MRSAICLALVLVAVSAGEVFAQNAYQLERLGVQAASKQDWTTAEKYLRQAAELGDYVSQFEYAFLLETSDPPVLNQTRAYAWYMVVVARKGENTDLALTCISRLEKKMSAAEIAAAKTEAAPLIGRFGKP